MKWAMMAAAAFVCINHSVGRTEPVRISVELVELDFTNCRHLAAQFEGTPVPGSLDAYAPVLAELERMGAKRVLLQHVQWLDPGPKVAHTTRINDWTFELALEVEWPKKGVYQVSVQSCLAEGDRKRRWEAPILLSPGQTITLGGVRQLVFPARNKVLEDLSGLVGAQKPTSLKITVPIINLDKADSAIPGSEHGSAGNPPDTPRMN